MMAHHKFIIGNNSLDWNRRRLSIIHAKENHSHWRDRFSSIFRYVRAHTHLHAALYAHIQQIVRFQSSNDRCTSYLINLLSSMYNFYGLFCVDFSVVFSFFIRSRCNRSAIYNLLLNRSVSAEQIGKMQCCCHRGEIFRKKSRQRHANDDKKKKSLLYCVSMAHNALFIVRDFESTLDFRSLLFIACFFVNENNVDAKANNDDDDYDDDQWWIE